ncbi:MAG: type II toxin-antitoxin system RelE/ParE family toxin [Rudaea sp.]
MTVALRVRPEAEADIQEAATWYEEQRAGLGHEFLDEVLRIFAGICAQPGQYPIVHRKARRALMHRFPFGVYYRVEQAFIIVVAVMHGRRHPMRWKSKS